jgi:PUA domain protein
MRHLSNKEKKKINDISFPGYIIDKRDEITDDGDILYNNGEKMFIVVKRSKKEIKKIIPHLKNLIDEGIPSVYVDRGAIPFLINGADIMRPGIQKFENFDEGDILIVRDEEYSKSLAIGEALFDSENMKSQKKGVSVKVLHCIGDSKY